MITRKLHFSRRSIFIFAIMLLGINLFTYLYWGKTLLNLTQNSFRPYLKNSSTSSKQTYKIDDYIITQEESAFDQNTRLGYCCLSFKKTTGRIEGNVISHRLQTGGIGKDDRFKLAIEASKIIDYERNGNVIYAYIKYTKAINDDAETVVYLYDYGNPLSDFEDDDDEEEEVYVHEFKPAVISDTCKYEFDNNIHVFVSPLGCAVQSDHKLKDIKLDVIFKNNKTYVFDEKKDKNTSGSGEQYAGNLSDNNCYQKIFVFSKPIDISNVDDVRLTYQ